MGASAPPPGYGGSGSPNPRVPGPLGVFATVQTAFGLYGADAVKLWQVVAVVIIPVEALVFVLRVITVPRGAVLNNSKLYLKPGTSDGGYTAISSLSVLLVLLVLLVCVGASYRILLGRHLHHPADLSTSFGFAVERVLPLVWVSVLTAVLVLLGLVVVLIGALYLFVCFALAVPVLMAEDRRGWQALRRSRELVSQHWWHVLGAIFVAAIVAGVGQVLVAVVADEITSGVSPHSVTAFLAVNGVVDSLVSILFYPFTAAVPVVIYVDMLVRNRDPQLERLLA